MANPSTRYVSSLRRGTVELAVLALLRHRSRYGQEIVTELADVSGLGISSGTIYPLLSRMLKDGLITSRWQESPVGPPRKYYDITRAGNDAFISLRTAWHDVQAGLDHLLKESS